MSLYKFIRYRNRKYYAPNSGMGYVNLGFLHDLFERGQSLVVRDRYTGADLTELTRIKARHNAELIEYKRRKAI